MRTFLNGLYKASGLAAAGFLAAIALAVVLQVAGRVWGMTVDSTEISGFFMAASTFLGLAYTFREGGHIRIELLASRLEGAARKALELWSCLVGAALSGYVSVYAVIFAYESHEFNDISPGVLAIPFWIPQAGMAAGLLILTVALLDAAWQVAHGRKAGYEHNEDAVLGE